MVDRLRGDEFKRKLSAADQQRLRDFIDGLRSSQPRGTPGSTLTQFAGILSEEAVDEMMLAIEEGCERIDGEA
jgi:hypothetical protein